VKIYVWPEFFMMCTRDITSSDNGSISRQYKLDWIE